MKLPDKLVKTLHNVRQDAGAWLDTFGTYLARLETGWHIQVERLVPDLSFNIVAFAKGRDGAAYILKMSPPGKEFTQEVKALELYGGDGIARLIRADINGGAMLLERLEPGVSFWRGADDELATRTCARLLQKLWRPVEVETRLCSLEDWTVALRDYAKQYPDGGGFIPHTLADRANGLLTELLSEEQEQVLLHADLHHGNILSATRAPYLAIDPKGIVGARGFDVTAFLGNPHGVTEHPDFRELLGRRVAIFSEMLGLSAQEIAMWGTVFNVLSNCWAAEDGGSWDFRMAKELEHYL